MSVTVPKYYYNDNKRSFAYSTARSRWPKILDGAIGDISNLIRKQSKNEDNDSAYLEQAKVIESQLIDMKDELLSNKELSKFNNSEIPGLDFYDKQIEEYKKYLLVDNEEEKLSWLNSAWLFSETYFYRRIDVIVKNQDLFEDYDIFENLKQDTFKSSHFGVEELAIHYKQLHYEFLDKFEKQKASGEKIEEKVLELLFDEFAEISLWGNATDLSLLTNATLKDIQSVQGKEARKKSEEYILINELDRAWKALYHGGKNGDGKKRVDFILDNSGFEVYTDLVFSLFLLDSKIADEIVLHCKPRPWMVSDVTKKDFFLTIEDLLDKDGSFFGERVVHKEELKFVGEQIQKYYERKQIILKDNEFWTLNSGYWDISGKKENKELYDYLLESSLIIFKGDLNYRKLTDDRVWDRSVDFSVAIQDLAWSKLKMLSLRTCKADVVAGLPKGKDEELCKYWESLGNEVGELWCSSGKWAVMSFSDGKQQQ
ncbi:putative methyltransferase [Ascoidea rubescens DSM 1968]|uniref:Sugar phosphate phosphatase n=1 Tax=Ascoidea rubescens DSM 1968 TaxID=1344418 RepID=A0A1D2VPH2_9ASCO|nr:HRT2 Ty3 transposition effector [Ascoidea rubescens DSM 1968]ODV63484.1 HRT2 Ty3 transposition effector [Ascoidea rubescens DSM 1968]